MLHSSSSIGVMETRDHSEKNGASLKSQMNRRNKQNNFRWDL